LGFSLFKKLIMENFINELDFKNIFKEVFELKRLTNQNECSGESGIYFLFEDDIIVYIGITKHFNDRIFNGRTPHIESKEFDSYSILPIKKENYILEKLEDILINFFNPEYNVSKRKQVFLNELPKDYREKAKNKEIQKSRKNAIEMMYFFNKSKESEVFNE